jgi:hypothetical protein
LAVANRGRSLRVAVDRDGRPRGKGRKIGRQVGGRKWRTEP